MINYNDDAFNDLANGLMDIPTLYPEAKEWTTKSLQALLVSLSIQAEENPDKAEKLVKVADLISLALHKYNSAIV